MSATLEAPPVAAAAPPSTDSRTDPINPGEGADNPFAELEALDNADKAKVTAPRREVKAPERSKDAPATAPDKKDDKPVKEGAEKPEQPMRTSELRVHYDKAKAKLADLEPKLAKAEQELTELRTKQPDLKPFQDKMTALEKQNAELLEEIRYTRYEKHPDFIKNFKKPYEEKWSKALGEIAQLNIKTVNAETGEETIRKATANDMLMLANAPLDQLDELAEKWFGKSAPRVIRHIEQIRDLAEAQDKALTDARAGAGERETKMQQEARIRDAAVSTSYAATKKELAEKYPKFFAPVEGDKEGNDLLEKGFAYTQSVFGGNGKLTPEQKVKRLAVIEAKAANHDRLAFKFKAANDRIKDLEADLAEYEKHSPDAARSGSPKGGSDKGYMESAMAEIESLDKK